MTLEEAKKILSAATRSELQDHAFGDREVTWVDANGDQVGFYCNSGRPPHEVYVSVWDDDKEVSEAFSDRSLLSLGGVGRIDRNDSGGPDSYQEGSCMPGLTLEGVKKEICTPPHPADVGDPDMDDGEWSWDGR